MKLPSTSAPQYLYFNPSARYTLFDKNLNATSVINKITELPVVAGTVAPIWNGSALLGTYFSQNWGSNTGLPAISCTAASSQYMTYNQLATSVSGAETNFTMCAMVSCNSPSSATARTVWGFGSAGTTPKLSLQYQSGSLKLIEVNGSGTFTASVATDSNVHVVTAIRNNNTLILRVDGVQVSTASITAGTEAFTTFSIGALNFNGSVATYFDGNIGQMFCYGGNGNGNIADTAGVETFMMAACGNSRLNG